MEMSSKKWSFTWMAFSLLSRGCRWISLLKCASSTLGSDRKRFLGRKSITLMFFLSSQLQAASLTDPLSLMLSSYLSMKSFRVSFRLSQIRLLIGETSFSFFSCSSRASVFSYCYAYSSPQEELSLSSYSYSVALLSSFAPSEDSLTSLMSDFLLGDSSTLTLSSLSTLLPCPPSPLGRPVVWLFLRWYSSRSHSEMAFSWSLKFLRFFLASSMERCLRRWTPFIWWFSRSIWVARSRKVILLSRYMTSICLSTSSLHLQYFLTAPQLQLANLSRNTLQTSCAMKQRKLYFLRLTSFSSFLQSTAPRLISKAQLLQILTMKRHMVSVPKSPPMQDRISSSLVQLRSIWMELGDLKMKKVQQLVLSGLTQYLFLMALLVTMPPVTSEQAERGEMLLSVVMVQSSIISCASSPPVCEKMMQLESSRQQVRNSAMSGLISGFTKQIVKKTFWLLLRKYSSMRLGSTQGRGSMLLLVHSFTDTSMVFCTGEEYLPPIWQSTPRGRHSQQSMLRSSNFFWMAGQPRQCSRVQGSSRQGMLWLVGSPKLQFWLTRLMSKQRSAALRSWCQISTPNMNGTRSVPLELRVKGVGSSAFWLVVVELMLSMLRVLSTLLEKATSRAIISIIEKTPPIKVWCQGYPWYRRNSVVLKKSHFWIPFRILRTAFISSDYNNYNSRDQGGHQKGQCGAGSGRRERGCPGQAVAYAEKGELLLVWPRKGRIMKSGSGDSKSIASIFAYNSQSHTHSNPARTKGSCWRKEAINGFIRKWRMKQESFFGKGVRQYKEGEGSSPSDECCPGESTAGKAQPGQPFPLLINPIMAFATNKIEEGVQIKYLQISIAGSLRPEEKEESRLALG